MDNKDQEIKVRDTNFRLSDIKKILQEDGAFYVYLYSGARIYVQRKSVLDLIYQFHTYRLSSCPKKEFITTWSPLTIPSHDNLAGNFFDTNDKEAKMILPDDIPYNELYPLPGQKTRVTIELLPW